MKKGKIYIAPLALTKLALVNSMQPKLYKLTPQKLLDFFSFYKSTTKS